MAGRRRERIGLLVVMLGFLVFMIGTTVAAVTGIVHPALVALVGFALLIVGGFVFAWQDEVPRRTPGSPPILLRCPNCGGAPRGLPESGAVTCDYCGTRFLV